MSFSIRLSIETVPSDAIASQWEVYDQYYSVNRIASGEPIYRSDVLTSNIDICDVELPLGRFDLNWGATKMWVRVRFKNSKNIWLDWSNLTASMISNPVSLIQSFERGPVELGDLSQGLQHWTWRAVLRADGVFLSRESNYRTDWRPEEFIFTPIGNYDEAVYFGMTIDQNGHPMICYEIQGEVYIYFYNSLEGDFVNKHICTGRCPVIRLDWKNRFSESADRTDVLLFYIDNDPDVDEVLYRRQRDRFNTIYHTGIREVSGKYLKFLDYTKDFRLCLVLIEVGSGYGCGGTRGNCFNFGTYVSEPYFPELLDKVCVNSVKILSGKRKDTRPGKNEELVSHSHMLSGKRKQIFYYYDFNTSNEYITVNNADVRSASRQQIFYYYDLNTYTDYCMVNNVDVLGGVRNQIFYYVNINTSKEYLSVNNVNIVGGSRYVP